MADDYRSDRMMTLDTATVLTNSDVDDVISWAKTHGALPVCILGATTDGKSFSAWSEKMPANLRIVILENELSNLKKRQTQ
jgi:hypothetical protein